VHISLNPTLFILLVPQADMVIEAVFEEMSVKHKIIREMEVHT